MIKVLKVTRLPTCYFYSLQYPKKELGDGFHFLHAVYASRINPLSLKESTGRLVIVAKGFLKLPNLHMLLKQKSSIISRKLGSRDFWRIVNSVLKKGKSAVPLLFNVPEVLSSATDKAKLLAENFSENSNLDDSGISLPVFLSRTNFENA